jgi:ethanolamine ammonia-lyase small subunit
VKPLVTSNPWDALRQFTRARIALGRAGDSLPTTALLEFGLAHAQARDAVHQALDVSGVLAQLDSAGFRHVRVHSAAADRTAYLRRPDWGRILDDESRQSLATARAEWDRTAPGNPDAAFVIADGLSARAAATQAISLLAAVLPLLSGWRIAPIVVAEQARVALGDEIGVILGAAQVVMLIGERPGLSSPDSMGIYLTFAPRAGRTDAERNCISNVRPEGLRPHAAAGKLAYLLHRARQLGQSGIELKDESDAPVQLAGDEQDGV